MPRPHYEPLLEALEGHRLEELRERVQADCDARGVDFGDGEPLKVDPVPRAIEAEEWRDLEAGIVQRARALNAFVLDVYGEGRIFAQGAVPSHLLREAPGYEPLMRGLLDPSAPPATVIGLDVVRDASGEMLVLEDNDRMPSGAAYELALREVVPLALGAEVEPLPIGDYAAALGSGKLRCLNAFGSGVADDKLAHAYVEPMIRFYLDEEPLLRSVPSHDLCNEEARGEAFGRLDELTIKPRGGYGGQGVTVMPAASAEKRREVRELVRRHPQRFVAQETISLSTHPTVQDGRLEPRRVDLRPFALSGAGETKAMPGGLTRFAASVDSTIVNSSQGGGCKDTWVLSDR